MAGPFLGAFVAAWLISAVSWRADYGVLAALHVVSTICVITLGDETLYDRDDPQPRGKGVVAKLKLVLGITGIKESRATKSRPAMMTVFVDIFRIQIKPNVFLVCGVFVIVLFAWYVLQHVLKRCALTWLQGDRHQLHHPTVHRPASIQLQPSRGGMLLDLTHHWLGARRDLGPLVQRLAAESVHQTP